MAAPLYVLKEIVQTPTTGGNASQFSVVLAVGASIDGNWYLTQDRDGIQQLVKEAAMIIHNPAC